MSDEEVLKPLYGVWECDNSRSDPFEELLVGIGMLIHIALYKLLDQKQIDF